jgi:hypothetical protein
MCLVPVIPLSCLPDLLLALAVAHPKNLFCIVYQTDDQQLVARHLHAYTTPSWDI